MPNDALRRGARGGGILVVGQFSKISVQMVGVVILSRLLTPEDFGLIALVAVFLALGDLLRDFGMPVAALQAKTLSHQQASNVFWVNGALGIATACALVAVTPVLVRVYHEPRLWGIVPAMALAMVVNGFQSQVQVQLARSRRFSTLAWTDVFAQVAGLAIAVALATAGAGYWALVAQVLLTAVVLLAARAAFARWIPSRPRRGHGSRLLLRSGTDLGLAQLLTFMANNVDTLAIGARWGPASLGFYSRAFQMYILPRNGLLSPLTQVVVPTANLATAAGDSAERVLLRVQAALGTLSVWIYTAGAVAAPWLVPLVLGDQWSASIPVFVYLAIGGGFAAFTTVNYWALVLEGKTRQLLHLHLVTKPLTVVLVLVAVPWGIDAVALAYSLALALSWPINLIWIARVADHDSWAFFKQGAQLIAAGALAALVAWPLMRSIESMPNWLMVSLATLVVSAVYTITLALLPRGRSDVWPALRYLGRATTAGR